MKKVELVVDKFNAEFPHESSGPVLPNVRPFNFQEMKAEIMELLESFYGAPFTIQRICELLTSPLKHYRWCDKFMRGLEKNVRVVTVVEPRRLSSAGSSESSHYSAEDNLPVGPPDYSNATELLSASPLPSSSSYINGLEEKGDLTLSSLPTLDSSTLVTSPLREHCSLVDSMPTTPAPLQQLDSFTTVFASPPSTPLAVVSDMQIEAKYDSGSSSSSSSSDSSPQPSSSSLSPPFISDASHSNDDSDFEDAKADCDRLMSNVLKEENHSVNNSIPVIDDKNPPQENRNENEAENESENENENENENEDHENKDNENANENENENEDLNVNVNESESENKNKNATENEIEDVNELGLKEDEQKKLMTPEKPSETQEHLADELTLEMDSEVKIREKEAIEPPTVNQEELKSLDIVVGRSIELTDMKTTTNCADIEKDEKNQEEQE